MKHWQPEIGSWLEKLAMLDAALTRKPWKDVCHTASNHHSRLSPMGQKDFCLGEIYYLSDGGYSRLCWSMVDNKLTLTDSSRQEVKDMWINCKELISDIEVMCEEFIKAHTKQ